jgi:hypothetical protein
VGVPRGLSVARRGQVLGAGERTSSRDCCEPRGWESRWTGRGLEYSLFPSGQRSLGGFAENSQVTFGVELLTPHFFEGDSAGGVEAEISVRCDHPVDCGMHRVEFRQAVELGDPAQAIAVLDDFTIWLLRRSSEVAPDEWQRRDPHASAG